jgi:hemerythrin-like domain-containing protein
MPSESLHSTTAARNAALAHLRDEHRSTARVLEALETFTAQAAEEGMEPDFALLATLLYYLDVFPERVHHPKEDRYLFSVLRVRSPQTIPLLDRLEREHRRLPDLLSELERGLVHWQGGAPDGTSAFALALARFCELNWEHMRTEESTILPEAERTLTDPDWLRMAEAFGANDDPLFGAARRREFERLCQRIAHLTPRKLKLTPLDPADASV